MVDRRSYLYKYTVFEAPDRLLVAEYESDAAPPSVGAFIDLGDLSGAGDRPSVFRVLTVMYQPYRSEEVFLSSHQTLIVLSVKREHV
jgi:hypothetical protein